MPFNRIILYFNGVQFDWLANMQCIALCAWECVCVRFRVLLYSLINRCTHKLLLECNQHCMRVSNCYTICCTYDISQIFHTINFISLRHRNTCVFVWVCAFYTTHTNMRISHGLSLIIIKQHNTRIPNLNLDESTKGFICSMHKKKVELK